MKVSDLIGSAVVTVDAEGPIGRLVDILIDVRSGQIERAVIDTGTALQARQAVVRHDNMALSDDGAIRLNLSARELADNQPAPPEDTPDGPLDVTAMPPVVVGPFGHVASPTMGAALANRYFEDTNRPDLDEPDRGLHWFDNLQDLPVFDETGEVGALSDVIVASETFTCQSIETRTAKGDIFGFGFKSIRSITQGEQSIILQNTHPPAFSAQGIINDMNDS